MVMVMVVQRSGDVHANGMGNCRVAYLCVYATSPLFLKREVLGKVWNSSIYTPTGNINRIFSILYPASQ